MNLQTFTTKILLYSIPTNTWSTNSPLHSLRFPPVDQIWPRMTQKRKQGKSSSCTYRSRGNAAFDASVHSTPPPLASLPTAREQTEFAWTAGNLFATQPRDLWALYTRGITRLTSGRRSRCIDQFSFGFELLLRRNERAAIRCKVIGRQLAFGWLYFSAHQFFR